MDPSLIDTAAIIFLPELVANLYADNKFVEQSRNWSSYTKAKAVSYAQSGAMPTLIINNSSNALTPESRTDLEVTYNLSEFQTKPTKLAWTDEYVTNYQKRSSVLSDHRMVSGRDSAERILYEWVKDLPAGNILRTSGGVRDAMATGATGNRKKVILQNIWALRLMLNKQEVPDDGRRILLLPADIEYDLMDLLWENLKYTSPQTLAEGSLGRIAGFNLYMRSKTVSFSNDTVPVARLPKDDDTPTPYAGDEDDNMGVVGYHPDFVTRSVSPDSLVDIKQEYGGVGVATTLLAGGRRYRKDHKGVVVLVEAHGA